MRVRFICGYYSDLAHKKKQRRPEDYWDAYNFCWGVKVGKFKHSFYIHDAQRKTQITAANFALARDTFGEWIEKSVPALGAGADIVLALLWQIYSRCFSSLIQDRQYGHR